MVLPFIKGLTYLAVYWPCKVPKTERKTSFLHCLRFTLLRGVRVIISRRVKQGKTKIVIRPSLKIYSRRLYHTAWLCMSCDRDHFICHRFHHAKSAIGVPWANEELSLSLSWWKGVSARLRIAIAQAWTFNERTVSAANWRQWSHRAAWFWGRGSNNQMALRCIRAHIL